MQIQLKQTEIIKAIKLYIQQQGINLDGKDVSMTFTAGRKEAGMSADVVIEDNTDIPEFGLDVDSSTPPVLTVVKGSEPPAVEDVEGPSSKSLFG